MAMLAMSGCVQNNGHIGHWFGQWKVERVTIDGQDDADYEGGVFFLLSRRCVRSADKHRRDVVRKMGGKRQRHGGCGVQYR